jgi:hypothetical protein
MAARLAANPEVMDQRRESVEQTSNHERNTLWMTNESFLK